METKMKNSDVNIALLNIFIQKYNKQYGKHDNMFDGIDYKDPISTTEMMEKFSEYMDEYTNLEYENEYIIDVCDEDTFVIFHESFPIYGIISEGEKIEYYSHSYLSLLYFGCENYLEGQDWRIKKIK
jgi:hypothetical protein